MAISDNLQKVMKLKGIQAAGLAQLSGVPASRISEIVTGKTVNPQLKTIQKLATALGVSVSELTGADEAGGHDYVGEEHKEYREEFNERKFLLKGIEKETEELTTAEFYKLMGAVHEVLEDLRKKRKGGQ